MLVSHALLILRTCVCCSVYFCHSLKRNKG